MNNKSDGQNVGKVPVSGTTKSSITLKVNGAEKSLEVASWTSLLDNPLGAKGLGDIGIVGVAAAIANAVFHATGKRVRDLPITLDKLL